MVTCWPQPVRDAVGRGGQRLLAAVDPTLGILGCLPRLLIALAQPRRDLAGRVCRRHPHLALEPNTANIQKRAKMADERFRGLMALVAQRVQKNPGEAAKAAQSTFDHHWRGHAVGGQQGHACRYQ